MEEMPEHIREAQDKAELWKYYHVAGSERRLGETGLESRQKKLLHLAIAQI
jgi:hypothetical protein